MAMIFRFGKKSDFLEKSDFSFLALARKTLTYQSDNMAHFWFDKKSDFFKRISILWLEREKLIPINPITWPTFGLVRNPIFWKNRISLA
jgi:hypothetical protein